MTGTKKNAIFGKNGIVPPCLQVYYTLGKDSRHAGSVEPVVAKTIII